MNLEKATHLKIKIVRDGQEKVNLTFPIFTLSVLDTVMPDHVLQKIKDRGIDLKKKIEDVHNSGNTPQEIFYLEVENSIYRVWSE